MSSNIEWKPVRGVVVTTQRVDAYGGVRFPREVLDQVASDINRDGIPMSQHHDPSQRIRMRGFGARVGQLDDGEFGVFIEAEVHPDDAHAIDELGSLSITMVAPLEGREDVPESSSLTIAGNPAWFPDSALRQAEDALSQAVPDANALRLYEFSFDPDPNLVIEIIWSSWQLISGNALWDAIKYLFRGRATHVGRETAPTRVTVGVTNGTDQAFAKVETLSEETAERAFDSFDKAVELMFASTAEPSNVMWNDVEERWEDTAGPDNV